MEVYSPSQRADIKPEGRKRSKSQSVVEGRSRSGSKSQPDKVDKAEGRERSDSNASAGKGKGRSLMQSIGSIGSFGMKSATSASKSASKAASKAGKSPFGRSAKYGNLSDDEERERVALDSDDDPYKRERSPSPTVLASRARSQSVVSVVSGLPSLAPPDTRRRALTSPPSPAERWVKVLFDYEGREADELPLRRGQIVEVTSVVSSEWLMGEVDGRSGMFPKSYTEEVVQDKPVIPVRPAMPKHRSLPPRDFRRSMPPVPFGHSPSKAFAPASDLDSGSEQGVEMDDGLATALVSATQPAPTTAARSRSGSTARKPAPPPPPSRRATGGVRSRSSTLNRGTPLASDEDSSNQASLAGSGVLPSRPVLSQRSSGHLSPPRFTSPQASTVPAARSPFEHSDDEDTPVRPLAHGLSALHLRNNGTEPARPDCGVCGCRDFTQNVFKSNGVCATCFHQH